MNTSTTQAAFTRITTSDNNRPNRIEVPEQSNHRVQSIDILRGLVMVIMALDHARDFFHKVEISVSTDVATGPTDMETTTPILFFTRWITHFCAPIFVFLSGTSISLMSERKSKKEISLFLLKRGLWLIFLELFVIGFSWTFNPHFNFFALQVIWAIGISMVILALMIFLPWRVILGIGFLIVFGHNLMDIPAINASLKGGFISDLVYFSKFSFYQISENRSILVLYSFLPWTGLMLLGYCLGKLYAKNYNREKRKKVLLQIGFSLVLFFFILRAINVYGDPVPWSTQPRGWSITVLSFFNVNKYPPSLAYLCMTIGVGLILLVVLEGWKNWFMRTMNIFGRVPLFYYILHFYLIHTLVVVVFYLSGYGNNDIVPANSPFYFKPAGFGFPLWGVYLVWLFMLLVLYPLCKRYDQYKSANKKWWLSYL